MTCPDCEGRGHPRDPVFEEHISPDTCSTCRGTGKIEVPKCQSCGQRCLTILGLFDGEDALPGVSGTDCEGASVTDEMKQVSSEPCRCISCHDCDGRGSYAVNMRGQYVGPSRTDDLDDLETCESCGGSGVTETCDRCQLLEEMADARFPQ